MLNSKEDWILIHNLHVLKTYSAKNSFNKRDVICTVLITLTKLRETGRTEEQPGSGRSRTSRRPTAENIDAVNDWQSVMRVHQGHMKLPVRSPGKLAFHGGQ